MSTVHLNRKLKEFNITPGELMRSAKMKLAQKLYNDGVSIDKISARIGYSSRYVKRHISNPVEIK